MPVGSTPHCSVQVPGFGNHGCFTPVRRLYPLPVRQASALPTASSRPHLAAGAVAAQLALPLAGYAEDLHLQESAPCRAHHKKPRVCRGVFAPLDFRAPLSAAERTAALAGALRTLLRFVDPQRAASHLKAVEGLNRALRLGLRHIDEAEATRFAGLAVVDELHRFDFSMALEQSLHVLFGGGKGEVPHVDRRHPSVSLLNRRTAASRTRRSHVPREQSNRSRLQGTRSAVFSQCAALGPAACTCVRARIEERGRAETKSTNSNKGTQSTADTNARSMLLPAFPLSKPRVAPRRSVLLHKSGARSPHMPGAGVAPRGGRGAILRGRSCRYLPGTGMRPRL